MRNILQRLERLEANGHIPNPSMNQASMANTAYTTDEAAEVLSILDELQVIPGAETIETLSFDEAVRLIASRLVVAE
jgi:hypothetical protein